jgi:hypothetical protein
MDTSYSFPVGFGELEIPLKSMIEWVANNASRGTSSFASFVHARLLGRDRRDIMSGLEELDASAFINWDPKYLSEFYAGEDRDQLGFLPYSKEVIWSEKANVRLNVVEEVFKFRYSDKTWRETARRGFDALSEDRLIYDKGHAIRLFKIDRTTGDVDIQPALYSQQARSNLIPDYTPKPMFDAGGHVSLRQQLRMKYGPILPPLDEPRLANTLGISVIVLCHDEDGVLRPLLQLRAAENAAMNNSGVHCTGSRAALWPRDDQSGSVQSFFDDEAYAAVERDFDLRRSEGEVSLYPAALVREHARMGKPQLFYFGYTKKPLKDVLRFRLEVQKESEISTSPRIHKYRSMTLDQFRNLILTDIWQDRERYKLTHEAYAMLWLLMDDFGKRYL